MRSIARRATFAHHRGCSQRPLLALVALLVFGRRFRSFAVKGRCVWLVALRDALRSNNMMGMRL